MNDGICVHGEAIASVVGPLPFVTEVKSPISLDNKLNLQGLFLVCYIATYFLLIEWGLLVWQIRNEGTMRRVKYWCEEIGSSGGKMQEIR